MCSLQWRGGSLWCPRCLLTECRLRLPEEERAHYLKARNNGCLSHSASRLSAEPPRPSVFANRPVPLLHLLQSRAALAQRAPRQLASVLVEQSKRHQDGWGGDGLGVRLAYLIISHSRSLPFSMS